MKKYLNKWKIIEGSLRENRIAQLPDCLEKEHLFQIRKMLVLEGFDPDIFCVEKYPTSGIYCCKHTSEGKYFIVQEYKGVLAPYYTTWKMNKEGINNFPCKSIKESISLTEY
ncbi:hypothetical protein D920_00070 [Enterococcus faecalis 13-SD-W-01]|nr:hypothetical protein D920_00070 [Enterococcus faecalis 13-SD-W-01]